MKKLAIILAIMMIPFSAFALDTISDADLNDLTGQAGVSIFLNTIRIEKSNWVTGYGDENGDETAVNWLLTQTTGSTSEISFLGSRTLDIDIVSRAEFTTAVALNQVPGVEPGDADRFGGLEMSALREASGTPYNTFVLDADSDGIPESLPLSSGGSDVNSDGFPDYGTGETLTNSDHVSDVAVVISLPNGIQIANFGELKTIGLLQVEDESLGVNARPDFADAKVLIKTYSGGGTTTITGAGGAASANNVHIGIMAHD
jgi:hypothetical protein